MVTLALNKQKLEPQTYIDVLYGNISADVKYLSQDACKFWTEYPFAPKFAENA